MAGFSVSKDSQIAGQKMKQILKQQNITQEQAAFRLGLASQSSLNSYLSGRTEIPLNIINRFCSEFNVPVETLFATNEDQSMSFADKLKHLRNQRNLTQIELANNIGISFSVISQIESGTKTPSKEVAKSLSDYFNVPLATFIVESYPLEDNTSKKTVCTADILTITDIVQEFFKKNGYTITAEQRIALVDHFYQKNIKDSDKIKEILSAMQLMLSKGK